MSLTVQSVLNMMIKFTANFSAVSPLGPTLPANVPLSFAGVTNLNILTGSFTPDNNEKVILNNISSIAPNFLFLLVDQPIVFSSDNNMFSELAVNKVLLVSLPTIIDGGNPWNSFTIDGRTSASYPMAQGILVNYTMMYGQAAIT